MKLKPLIKTHWVASQNPMMVSMAGLRRVVFSPPMELMSLQFSDHSEIPSVDLPALSELSKLSPDTEEIREVRAKSHTLSKNLFWALFSGHEVGYLGSSYSLLLNLAQSIEFHFDDGQCLGLPGIFRKPGFPRFLDPQFYLQDSSCNWERAFSGPVDDLLKALKLTTPQKKQDDIKRTWILILEILAWALQRKRQVGDLEVLWNQKETGSVSENPSGNLPRLGFHLEDIHFLKALPMAATVLTETATGNFARIRLWQGHESPPPPGVLCLHSAEVLGTLENYFLSHSEILPTPSEVAPAELQALEINAKTWQWQSSFACRVSGIKELLRSLTKLEVSIGRDQVIFIHHTLISGAEFKPHLKARECEGALQVAVSFSIEGLQLEHLNFPTTLLPALAPFMGGMDHFFGFDRKDIASRHNQYRVNDLLFLRHQGLALFCLFELINWILKKPLSSGEEILFVDDLSQSEADRQFEKLIKYLQASIPALLGKSDLAFNQLVSPAVQNYFHDFIEKLFHSLMNDRSLIFQGDQVIEIKLVQHQVLPIIRFLILHFIESSRGKFLTRSLAPVGETFIKALVPWTEPHVQALGLATPAVSPVWVDVGLFDKYAISLLFELSDQGSEIELNGSPLLSQSNPFEFVFSVSDSANKEDSNWFDLHPQIFFNGTRVSAEDVKINFGQGQEIGQIGFIEYQGQIYRIDKRQLPSLRSLQRFWSKIKGARQLLHKDGLGDKVYRLQKSQALELLMLKSQGFEVKVEGQWKRIFDYFENGLGVEKIQLPETMQKKLLPHQLEGAQWLHDLYELKLGAILADEMGLGKTFLVLSFLVSLFTRAKLNKCLIIVPTSLVYNWTEEKKKFAPELPMRIFYSNDQEELKKSLDQEEPLVVVATYGLLVENLEFFQAIDWNVLAFDEAQNLKNINSQRSVSARQLKAQFKICVTGTPMENNYLEFFSLCDLVVPGCLGEIAAFRKEYLNLEVRAESLRDLRLISKPLLLRRTKLQVKLSLPMKTVHSVSLPFGEKQKEIYKKMAMTFSRQVEELIENQGERKAQIAMFAALMRLRQICSDPAAVPGVVYLEQPAKVEHFLGALQDHLENNESVVVFTQFLSTLGRIEMELLKLKVPTYTLQGNVSAKERLRLISAFQDSPEPGVMLMTLKTGGVGLNLTKASVVYHMEPWWNPAVENQATDRTHRMGQTKDVHVYNLLIEGSLEERIAELKLKKQGSFDRLFGNSEKADELGEDPRPAGSGALSREDFIYLLK